MEDVNQADHLSKWLDGIKFPNFILSRIYHDNFLDSKPYKCPLNNCMKQFFVMAELKNHVLDHDSIYRRQFEWFQRVKVVDDDDRIYVIIYADRETDSFLIRCDGFDGRHNFQYVPSERLLPVIVPKINDIVAIENEDTVPTQKGYTDGLRLAVITEHRKHEDGHSVWIVQFINHEK